MPRALFLCLGLLLGLGACAGVNPPSAKLPQMTFANLQALQIDVARVEVVSKYQPPAQAPHIEYDMPVAPENAIKRWVQDRLQPVGRSGVLRVTILDAQATENPLKTDTGVKSVFEKQQVARVDVAVEVSLQILDERQFPVAEASAKASRSRTLPEGMKLNERDSLLYDLVEGTMLEFNTNIDPYIRTSFARWLGVR
ncbi:MAG TPA: hypothetical protein HPQ04_06045 [Rhodospirillaceae bacterium]|nr:hypothetical protein [Rhodospirillaceae bacterium]